MFNEFVGIITTIILIYVGQFYYKYFTRINPLPGAIPLPFIGDIFGILYYAKGDVATWHGLLREKYGDVFEVHIGNLRKIAFARADHIEKLMSPSTKSNYMIRSTPLPVFHELGVAGKGLLMNYDIPTWKFNRKFFSQAILTPSFSREALNWTTILFNELNEYWKEIGENSGIDFAIWIHRFTTEIIFQMTVGMKVNSMATLFNSLMPSNKKHIELNPVIEDIEDYVNLIMAGFDDLRFAIVYPPFIRYSFMKERNQVMFNNIKRSRKVMRDIIDYRRKEIEQTPTEEELRHDILTSLITANTERDINESKSTNEENSKPLTNDQIGQNLIEAIAGGIDTTANVLSYIVYYMAHYPDVLARLREEIDSIFGSNPHHQLTIDDLSKMNYTEAVIKECSRLVNPIKLMDRVSSATDVVAGYEWPANTTFTCYLEGIHHNSNHWKDPHKFDPDRFMGIENQKNSFLVFGGGVRMCPGRRLAIVELKCLTALIYRNLDISLEDMNAPLILNHTIVNTCTELNIKVKQRRM